MWSKHFHSSSPALFVLAFFTRPLQGRRFKTIKMCFWNVIKLLEVQPRSRPLRQGLKEGEERREVAGPAWLVWRVKLRFAPWVSWETPSPTVSGREATACHSFIRLHPWDRFSLVSQPWSWHLFLCFQFLVAGGAPRGWIMPCTALMSWLPSPRWLCLTFFTPRTGSPLT